VLKAIGHKNIDIAQRMDCTSKVSAMVHEWIRDATSAPYNVNTSKAKKYLYARLLPRPELQGIACAPASDWSILAHGR
jgi:hypothetical protein